MSQLGNRVHFDLESETHFLNVLKCGPMSSLLLASIPVNLNEEILRMSRSQ